MTVSRLSKRGLAADPVELVPFKDVCQRLGIHWNTGYRNRKKGRFPFEVLLVGSQYYCRRADVDEFVRAPHAS